MSIKRYWRVHAVVVCIVFNLYQWWKSLYVSMLFEGKRVANNSKVKHMLIHCFYYCKNTSLFFISIGYSYPVAWRTPTNNGSRAENNKSIWRDKKNVCWKRTVHYTPIGFTYRRVLVICVSASVRPPHDYWNIICIFYNFHKLFYWHYAVNAFSQERLGAQIDMPPTVKATFLPINANTEYHATYHPNVSCSNRTQPDLI